VKGQLESLGASREDAAAGGSVVYDAAVAVMGVAREYAREKFERLLQRVADEKRIAALMAEFDEASEA
jgi:hypothetical protein